MSLAPEPEAFLAGLARLLDGKDLDAGAMEAAMAVIMSGEATPAQIGGFLAALRVKGETVTEIAAAARVMRAMSTRVTADPERLVDTCGTGGDGRGLFNVSTAAAFVVAAAGGRVAKHGNRSLSGRSGSADLLEALGIQVERSPEQVADDIAQRGIGFMFAPAHHGATRHAAGPRRELGSRTLFNLLGPLTNPAGAPHQLLGVFDARWLRPLAEVSGELGSRRVLVVHSEDGLDEISIAAPTRVAELDGGEVREWRIQPEDLGIRRVVDLDGLVVDSPRASAELVLRVLEGRGTDPDPATDMVALNAAGALYACGVASDLNEGLERARDAIASGAALERLRGMVAAA